MPLNYGSAYGTQSPTSFDTYDQYVQAAQASGQPIMDQGQFISLKAQKQAPQSYEPPGPPGPPSTGQQAVDMAKNKGENYVINHGINAAQNYLNPSPETQAGNNLSTIGKQPGTPETFSDSTNPDVVKIPQGSTTGPNGEVLKPDGTATDPNTGQVIGRWAQGAAGAYLIYSGIQQFQQGNKVGGGISAAYGGTLAASALGSDAAASAVPVAGGIYGAYNLGKLGLQKNYSDQAGSNALQGAGGGAALGAAVGSVVPGIGTAIGAGVGAVAGGLYGAATGWFGSHKGLMQRVRDKWRENMGKAGLFDPTSYAGTLADGTPYDFGKDNIAFNSSAIDPQAIDQSKPSTVVATSYANALASLQGATGKAKQAIAAAWIQAATNNGAIEDPNMIRANLRHFLTQLKVSPDQAYQQIGQMAQADLAKGDPDGAKKQYYDGLLNNVQQIYGQAPAIGYDQVVQVMKQGGSQITPQNWNGQTSQPNVGHQPISQNIQGPLNVPPGVNLKSAQMATQGGSPSSPSAAATDPTSGISALMAAQQNQAIAANNQQMALQKKQLHDQAVMSILQNTLADNSQSSGIGQAYTQAFAPLIQQRMGGRPNG